MRCATDFCGPARVNGNFSHGDYRRARLKGTSLSCPDLPLPLPAALIRNLSLCTLLACFAAGNGTSALAVEVDPELRAHLISTINQSDSFRDKFDAEVWLLGMAARLQPYVKDPQQRFGLLRAIHKAATHANLPPDLVLAVIQIESRFDRYAVSSAGAQGLMQVMPFWKKEIGRPEDNLIDVETNLRYGCHILQFYRSKENGDLAKALARYNGSYGKTWYSELVLVAWQSRWSGGSL